MTHGFVLSIWFFSAPITVIPISKRDTRSIFELMGSKNHRRLLRPSSRFRAEVWPPPFLKGRPTGTTNIFTGYEHQLVANSFEDAVQAAREKKAAHRERRAWFVSFANCQ
ncbi:hypothetical protein BX666DRAFT_1877731 [Dichotomocladium elegans]|nr:hypothetical protein BX666DRAFT_1877731 [Dichotomocladium elegans]